MTTMDNPIIFFSMKETSLAQLADQFSKNEYFDYRVYIALSESETNPEFKKTLASLVGQELADYQFWKKHTTNTAIVDDVSGYKIRLFLAIRKIF